MNLIKVGATSLNQTPLNWVQNIANIKLAIQEAKKQSIQILCLPELCITGYGCEDQFHAPYVSDYSIKLLTSEILPETENIIVAVGFPLILDNCIFNATAIIANKEIIGVVPKQHLAGDGIHYEPRWFKPWPKNTHVNWNVVFDDYQKDNIPIGDISFNYHGVIIRVECCEDAWVADRPNIDKHADVILNPSASHFSFGKYKTRKRIVAEGSRIYGAAYVYSNLIGNESGRVIFDGGEMIADKGEVIATGERFHFKNVNIISAVVDIDDSHMGQIRSASTRPIFEDHINIDMRRHWMKFDNPIWQEAAWENSTHIKGEEFIRAEALGLFDYMRKTRSSGYVISLSGGADSTACACLVFYMVQIGCQQLGEEEFLNKLNINIDFSNEKGYYLYQRIVNEILTCVYQKTRNSSVETESAARSVAEYLGAEYHHIDIDSLVEQYTSLTESILSRKLTWEEDDLTLQNIQARVRAPGIWMVTNALGNRILMTTSNRSEAAVGYATLDGDTCGSLAPIAGIDKDFIRQWLRWIWNNNDSYLQELPCVDPVIRNQPTAELRPGQAQTDEDDLMPYDVLNRIQKLAIRDKKSPLDIYERVVVEFPVYSPEKICSWIEKFFRLWARNQFKRERYAPAFHLDDENLDPKTWCKFPIISGGFDMEIFAMKEYIKEKENESVTNEG